MRALLLTELEDDECGAMEKERKKEVEVHSGVVQLVMGIKHGELRSGMRLGKKSQELELPNSLSGSFIHHIS